MTLQTSLETTVQGEEIEGTDRLSATTKDRGIRIAERAREERIPVRPDRSRRRVFFGVLLSTYDRTLFRLHAVQFP